MQDIKKASLEIIHFIVLIDFAADPKLKRITRKVFVHGRPPSLYS